MKPFNAGSDTPLSWIRTRTWPGAWELRAGDELIGTLSWPRYFRTEAEGETSEGRWLFRCTSLLCKRTEVIDTGTQGVIAVFERRFTGKGEVTFPDGRRVLWNFQGLFPRVPLFETTDGFPIMRFPVRWRSLRSIEPVEIDDTARGMKELPLLALLGRYLIVLQRRRQRH